ncbi:MAG TPA: DUF6491 family protein [Caulobacteraceae bacterium]|nr:DUF6491 family protein [Caulobacteraceae bacterium]
MVRLSKTPFSLALALAAVGLVCVGSSSPQPARAQSPAQPCFYGRDVNGFNAPNDHTLYIRVGASDVFRLDLQSSCTGLTFRQNLGISSSPAEGGFICTPLQAEVVYRDNGFSNRCPVVGMHKLSAVEVAALPKRDLP